MNLIMYEPNIYVNNSKFISIVDNVSVLQLLPDPWGPFYITENLPRLTVFNNILSVSIYNIRATITEFIKNLGNNFQKIKNTATNELKSKMILIKNIKIRKTVIVDQIRSLTTRNFVRDNPNIFFTRAT